MGDSSEAMLLAGDESFSKNTQPPVGLQVANEIY